MHVLGPFSRFLADRMSGGRAGDRLAARLDTWAPPTPQTQHHVATVLQLERQRDPPPLMPAGHRR